MGARGRRGHVLLRRRDGARWLQRQDDFGPGGGTFLLALVVYRPGGARCRVRRGDVGLAAGGPPFFALPAWGSAPRAMLGHLRNPPLAATYAVGFCVLFTLIATFTYVNFYLAAPPFRLAPPRWG